MIKCVMFLVETKIVEIQENKIILLNHTQNQPRVELLGLH